MTWYICKKCYYRFESQLEKAGKKCPYCDKGIITKESDAEELLSEGE